MSVQKFTVIYADDDADDRELIRDAFFTYDDHIHLSLFENGLQALNYLNCLPLSEPSPCLIILDINMPLMSGKEVLKTLRAMSRYQNTPVILFTTSSIQEDRDFAAAYQAKMITKPNSFEKIQQIARQFADTCAEDVKQSRKLAALA